MDYFLLGFQHGLYLCGLLVALLFFTAVIATAKAILSSIENAMKKGK